MILALLLAGAVQTAPVLPAADGTDLTVVVENVPDDHGVVRVDVCGPEGFLGGDCPRTFAVKAHAGEVTVHVPSLPPGDWAVQAYHDRDDNGVLTRNRLGLPTEAFGFSRSPSLGLHGPRFTAAAFAHGAQPQTVEVKLRRLFLP